MSVVALDAVFLPVNALLSQFGNQSVHFRFTQLFVKRMRMKKSTIFFYQRVVFRKPS